VFCAACGRNLAALQRLPTRAEWEGGRTGATAEDAEPRVAAMVPLARRCAEATAAFLADMHAAGDPGTVETPLVGRVPLLRRAPTVRGWVVRPVDRDDDTTPRRYTPGLVLSVDGAFHRLDSELRGWGQRDFPHYHHTVQSNAMDMPVEERLIDELAAVRHEQT
jgi:hypothetical protein